MNITSTTTYTYTGDTEPFTFSTTSSYKAIEIEKWGGSFKTVDKYLRELEPGELLIRVVCTTIHPADMTFVYGNYGRNIPKIFPVIPGFEAAGEIVKVADTGMENLVGSRVGIYLDPSFSSIYHGLWAQYAYVKLENCIFYNKTTAWKKMVFNINPLTCCGLVDTCRKKNSDCVVLDGAASDLGLMFNKLCLKTNIKVINLIRNKDEANDLKAAGATYILDISKSDWEKDLTLICNEFKPKLCFDCVGGDTTPALLKYMPNDSTIYHFGNLSEKGISNIDSRDLIFNNKKLKGWWLPIWLNKLDSNEYNAWQKFIVDMKESDSNIFATNIVESYKIDDISTAWKTYTGDMNKGKVLIYPQWRN